PDLRDLSFSVGAVDRDVFAERIPAADLHEASLTCEPAVLGFFSQDHADTETVALPKGHAGFDDAVGSHDRAVTDDGAGLADRIRPHRHPPTEAGLGMHDSRRMDGRLGGGWGAVGTHGHLASARALAMANVNSPCATPPPSTMAPPSTPPPRPRI